MELISIIVPIYKVEAYLDKCIKSITDQTYSNLEIILVDDGSPDNCGAICDAWAEKDSRIRVIHKENGGLSDARNAGLAIAAGELIAFVDSDDYIEPEFIRKLYDAMIAHNADIAECSASYVDENGTVLRLRESANCAEMGKTEALRRLVLEDGIYQTVWNKLYRREVMENILFEVGKYHEDEFWTYRVFDRIEKLAVVEEPLYNYLQRSSSIIGIGYNIHRLDGLEARFLRMQYLQKYPELATLTAQNLIMDCLWHYQSAKNWLSGEDRSYAIEKIRTVMKNCPKVPLKKLYGTHKRKIAYILFRAMSDLTVWVVNKVIKYV